MAKSSPRTCKLPDCDGKVVGWDMCAKHWRRWKTTGSTELKPRPKRRESCSVEGCDKGSPITLGWCVNHYALYRRNGVPSVTRAPLTACSVEGCDRGGQMTRELCGMHYSRLRAKGDPGPVERLNAERYGDDVTCSVPDCDRGGLLRRGWCGLHYQRWEDKGDALWTPPPAPVGCRAEGCDKEHASLGLCGTHYQRLYRTGSVDVAPKQLVLLEPCVIAGCGELRFKRDWCSIHYNRWKVHGDPLTLLRERNDAPPDTCTKDGCSLPHHAKGYCQSHYSQSGYVTRRVERNAGMREHYRQNREYYYAKTNRRRQRVEVHMDALDKALSAEYRKAIAKDPCYYCGSPGEQNDHFFPLAKFGTDHWFNIVRACEACNKSKAARCGTWFALRTGAFSELGRPAAVA